MNHIVAAIFLQNQTVYENVRLMSLQVVFTLLELADFCTPMRFSPVTIDVWQLLWLPRFSSSLALTEPAEVFAVFYKLSLARVALLVNQHH